MVVDQEPKKILKKCLPMPPRENYVRKFIQLHFSESVRFNMSLWYIGKMHVNG
jgi:hypothetical protein